MSRPFSVRRRAKSLIAIVVAAIVMALAAQGALAGPGYQLDSVAPSIPTSDEAPIGIAIDQSSQIIYVAEATSELANAKPGQIEQLNASGTPTADSPFGTGGGDLFVSVAVNPSTHGIYAYQLGASTPLGQKGETKISTFSSSGVLGTSFTPSTAEAGTLAVDASGRLFFPNSVTGSVQILSPSGTLEGSITCGACLGGAFSTPQAVAFDSAGNLYVVDTAAGGRVIKLAPSGGSYAYVSTLQSGAGAYAVAVDVSSNVVLVGDLEGTRYHVVSYDSSGTEFDDFGEGLVTPSQLEHATGQLAVNSTTHKAYLTNPGGKKLWVFEPIGSIPAPTAAAAAPTPVGQVTTTLRATVNPKGHTLTSCGFEYTDHADFLANGFADAKTAACPPLIGENASTPISAAVGSLTPGTSYDYRVKIASYGGAAESGSQTFETLAPLPPVATTGAASALTKTTATLAGSVDPKGGTISNCHFEWVTEAAFQATGFTGAGSKACTPTPSGNGTVSVTAKPSGLTAGTAYRFRVVATNNSGTGTATDNGFATVAETCSENVTLCPPSSGGGSQSSPPPVATAPAPTNPTPAPKPLKCRKGFKKKRVGGKLRCVKVKKHHAKR
jgi:hypothetical protein